MILNFNTAIFLGQAGLSLLLVLACFGVLTAIFRQAGSRETPSRPGRKQPMHFLLLLSSTLVCLLAIRLLSWLGYFWLLESYVPQIPGAMCPFGVAAATPEESRILQWSRLAVLIVGGGWVCFYAALWVSRRLALGKIVTGLAVPLLLLIAFDCVADVRFTAAKREGVAVSCCTTVRETPYLPSSLPAAESSDIAQHQPTLAGLFVLGSILAGLGWKLPSWLRRWAAPRAEPLVLLALAALGLYFLQAAHGALTEVLSPRLLGLPFHRCPFELVTRTPDFALIALLALVGGIAPLWACALSLLSKETSQTVRTALLRGSASALTIALLMVATHWVLAP